jgi:hypothetical protein
MKISHISAGLATAAAVLSCRYYFVMAENAKLRIEGTEFQQLAEAIQPQLEAKRQQLRVQQEKLNKGSAISQSVGPAVLADIRSVADKNNNLKLRELLARYGVRDAGTSGGTGGGAKPAGIGESPSSPSIETGAGAGTKKGGH